MTENNFFNSFHMKTLLFFLADSIKISLRITTNHFLIKNTNYLIINNAKLHDNNML